MGYHAFYAKAYEGKDYDQGNAILSKYEFKQSESHILSPVELYQNSAESESRIALEATIQINKIKNLNIFTTHLAYSHKFQASKFRDIQVENLLDLVKNKSDLILMGDFNSTPESKIVKQIDKYFINADSSNNLQPTWTVYPFN